MKFPDTTTDENKISYEEGLRIFGELRKKYCNDSVSDLDIVVNSLCAALERMGRIYVAERDYESFIDLITQILRKNLLKDSKSKQP